MNAPVPHQVTELEPAPANHLWTVPVRGVNGHGPFFDPVTGSLLYSDGWGNAIAAALRFRRLDAATGAEQARWPCGSAVRCHAPIDARAEMLVATDMRLAALDATTLAERRRWDHSVKHGDTVAVAGRVAVVANWIRPTISLVDLTSGAVRRKRYQEMTAIVSRPGGDPLLVGGSTGGIATLEPSTGAIRIVRAAPPALAAALARDGESVWLTTGLRVSVSERPDGASIRPGDATTRLERHPLAADGEPFVVELPLPVRTIAIGPGSIWLTPGPVARSEQFVLMLPDQLIGSVSVWRAEPGDLVEAVDPVARLILTTRRAPESGGTLFSCYRVAGAAA